MGTDIELFEDDHGFLIVGKQDDVNEALAQLHIEENKTVDMHAAKIFNGIGGGANLLQGMQENSGRWVKLTKDSAEKIKKYGLLVKKDTGNALGVIGKGGKGGIKNIVQFEKLGAVRGSVLNPANLAGVQMIMVTMAMQQMMKQMEDYLKTIDAKLDTVLRNQKNAQLAKIMSVNDLLHEAQNEINHIGRMSDQTWDQIQGSAATVNEVLRYAELQLNNIAQDILQSVNDTNRTKEALVKSKKDMREWLAVTAECLRLRDGVDVLKFQRYIGAGMLEEELLQQRDVMRENRDLRFTSVKDVNDTLRNSLSEAVKGKTEILRVLALPGIAPAVIHEANEIARALDGFDDALDNEHSKTVFEQKNWGDAMGEVGSGIVDGANQAVQGIGGALQQAGGAVGKGLEDAGKNIQKFFGGWSR